MQLDISVVLNIHREKELLAKTLLSIRDAADFAAAAGIAVELVMVLDSACDTTARIARGFQSQSFLRLKIVEVANRSLAHSRNDGIAAADGEYICITDGDDLFSYNRLVESLLLARKLGTDYIILPEYLISFGSRQGLSVLTGSGALTPLIFPVDHPYISSIFGHRSAFEKHKYVHPRGDRGHAYEDWHMNAELLADGYRYAVARNVALYYRNHSASIMAKAREATYPLTLAPTRLLEPENYLRIGRADVEAYEIGTKRPLDSVDDNAHLRDAFLRNSSTLEMMAAAGRIEPMISPANVGGQVHSQRFAFLDAGLAYYRLCEVVAGKRFTDVFVVPYFVHGGAEKYVRQIIESLLRTDPSRQILAIAMEYADEHIAVYDLPANVCFLDAYHVAGHLLPQQFSEITLKLIENTAPGARVHFRAGAGSHRVLEIALNRLGPDQIVYYHFLNHRSTNVDLDQPLKLVDQITTMGGHVVSDNTASTKSAQGLVSPRISYIPASCMSASRIADQSMRKRILWGSRVDREKRCDLLPRIAQLLVAADPAICIEMYGGVIERTQHLLPPKNTPGLSYCGPFDSFADLARLGHEIFLYTSWYDGMPNVVLEAMAHGKTVIAPDIGGIDDAVMDGKTGVLLPSDRNDARMAKAYADAVLALLSDPDRSAMLGKNAQAYINEVRTPERMDSALRKLFDIEPVTGTEAEARR
ncbi:glycosyltransferase [Aminobacter sp. HY435]|uniref:glycosyltransferase n=1 Tax=Aminobacter sp. HY435 TaxID=2970917 RepID=UPI0022B978C0|nr:glycosyltransferase [Aminobacter sp. HY435]